MRLEEFMFNLPPELIAQEPLEPRDACRMMVLNRATGTIEHRHFLDLADMLEPGDVVVINDTRVLPGVIRGSRTSGGQIELKLVSRKSQDVWDCLAESRRQLEVGEILSFGDSLLVGTVLERNVHDTGWMIRFRARDGSIEENLLKIGQYFLPLHLPQILNDPEDYQTVYAAEMGSLQPPTAGMHFTDRSLKACQERGADIVRITQHVGRLDKRLGEDDVTQHKLYEEHYQVSQAAADRINEAKRTHHTVWGIGTTVTRTLETLADDNGFIHAGDGWTDLYIYPGFKFRVLDHLLSNFQSPGITTLILACAFGGTNLVMSAYREAIQAHYRFLEFGDAILYL